MAPLSSAVAYTRKQLFLGGLYCIASQQFMPQAQALGLSCQGLKPYDMQKCLRERQEAEVRQ
jgi:hypothetical protein